MEVDYLVVGAGSAGCILAHRLSAAGASVLVLEAGPSDWHPMIHVPAGMMKLIANPAVNWNFLTAPEKNLKGRQIHWPRGRVLGGSSAINGMAYVRGNAEDFNHWQRLGCEGWDYESVLPFFKASERYAGGDEHYRGREGLIPVSDYTPPLEITKTFVEAARQKGFAFTEDINGSRQEGVGFFQMTRSGRFRASTATTFLRAARAHPGLKIETNATTSRLLFEGKTCVGVEYMQAGSPRIARARKEVILSAGAIGSPQILQLSGVGDPTHLAQIGVATRHELPFVGQNLRDHARAALTYRLASFGSVNELTRGWRLWREVMRWMVNGTGALTYGVTSAAVFCRSSTAVGWPDLQILFTPVSFDESRPGALDTRPGVTLNICPVRPESTGSVLAASRNPAEAPAIQPNYFSSPADMRTMLQGIRIGRDIMSADIFKGVLTAETQPGPQSDSDVELENYVRRTANSVYHPIGTCRMGTDADAVVDSRLRVRGLARLRVVDASVMPCLTTGNTAAPTMMIAEKGAFMILEDSGRSPQIPLSRANAA
jgi:choline dehydrogenase